MKERFEYIRNSLLDGEITLLEAAEELYFYGILPNVCEDDAFKILIETPNYELIP